VVTDEDGMLTESKYRGRDQRKYWIIFLRASEVHLTDMRL